MIRKELKKELSSWREREMQKNIHGLRKSFRKSKRLHSDRDLLVKDKGRRETVKIRSSVQNNDFYITFKIDDKNASMKFLYSYMEITRTELVTSQEFNKSNSSSNTLIMLEKGKSYLTFLLFELIDFHGDSLGASSVTFCSGK